MKGLLPLPLVKDSGISLRGIFRWGSRTRAAWVVQAWYLDGRDTKEGATRIGIDSILGNIFGRLLLPLNREHDEMSGLLGFIVGVSQMRSIFSPDHYLKLISLFRVVSLVDFLS